MLRTVRIILATIFFVGITLLFLDFTGVLHPYFSWMAKVQFLPALLALNLIIVGVLLVVTLIFGRIYCSVICPLGILQDIFGWLGRRFKKSRYTYSKPKNWIRYPVLALFVIALLAGINSFVALLAPYSAYGRIAQNIFSPISLWAFHKEIYIRSIGTFAVAAVTLIIIAVLAFRNGRTWCNTICPVGTILSFFSRFPLLRPVINTSKCVNCTLCGKKCKASCINTKEHKIDYSRCVMCGDCISNCHKGAISYTTKRYPAPVEEVTVQMKSEVKNNTVEKGSLNNSAAEKASDNQVNEKGGMERRTFLAIAGMMAATVAAKARDKELPPIIKRETVRRETEIVPAGAIGIKHFTQHCTACQLCVAVCPNKVLKPSGNLMTLMQPHLTFEKGFCAPECNKCSTVCPTGAIKKIDLSQKFFTQIGHAVWDASLCIPIAKEKRCGRCERHCPTGAITLVAVNPSDEASPRFPVVDEEICIGCGACENACPVNPIPAIYVEGHPEHKLSPM
ncbi:MAG: 4Fe-4S binding protein [Bacteroidales bacterium]|nr:4Fe-4S binding protein [Bacteroidales bacterium]